MPRKRPEEATPTKRGRRGTSRVKEETIDVPLTRHDIHLILEKFDKSYAEPAEKRLVERVRKAAR